MSNPSNQDQGSDRVSTEDSEPAKSKTVVATAYVPQSQYEKWEQEADERNRSISSFIASMVEVGVNDVQIEEESPSEIVELREQLREVRFERNKLQDRIKSQEQSDYQIGLGKIKELIIANPGIDRREIINHISQNPIHFANKYLGSLESSEFIEQDGQWYPPESMGGKE